MHHVSHTHSLFVVPFLWEMMRKTPLKLDRVRDKSLLLHTNDTIYGTMGHIYAMLMYVISSPFVQVNQKVLTVTRMAS